MKIFDTLTNTQKNLEFSDKVRIYLCGVTVYDDSHIGHARTIIVFDVLRRFLESKNIQVNLIQNFTDVDDKIIKKANDVNETAQNISNRYIQSYFDEFDKLNIKRAHEYPKATEHIQDMLDLVSNLVKKDIAYVAKNGVYFRVSKFNNYGKLSKKKIDDLESGSRIEIDESKEINLLFLCPQPYCVQLLFLHNSACLRKKLRYRDRFCCSSELRCCPVYGHGQ